MQIVTLRAENRTWGHPAWEAWPFVLSVPTPCRSLLWHHWPLAIPQCCHQLDHRTAGGQQWNDLPVRWQAGCQDPWRSCAQEPDRPVHHHRVDEAQPQPWRESREGNHPLQLRQNRWASHPAFLAAARYVPAGQAWPQPPRVWEKNRRGDLGKQSGLWFSACWLPRLGVGQDHKWEVGYRHQRIEKLALVVLRLGSSEPQPPQM